MRRAVGVRSGGVALLALALLSGCGLFDRAEEEAVPTRTGSVKGRVVLSGRQVGGLEGFIATVQGTKIASPVNPDGTFELGGVPIGEQTVSVVSEEGNLGAHVVAMVEPGKVTDVGELRPIATGMIAGIVTGKSTGGELKPVAEARVVAIPILSDQEKFSELANGRPFLVAETNRRGEYVIRAVPAGEYLLEASHPQYLPAMKEVNVEAYSTANGDLTMEPRPEGGAVYGKVVAEVKGKEEPIPVPGALVVLIPQEELEIELPPPVLIPLEATVGEIISSLQPRSEEEGEIPIYPWGPLFAFTDAEGKYRIEAVPAGKYRATAGKGYEWEEKEIEVPQGRDVEVNFTLRVVLGRITGVVKRADNDKPISGARVWAFPLFDAFVPWEEGIGERPPQEEEFFCLPLMRDGTVTDEQGRYTLEVRPGRYVVDAWAMGFERSAKEAQVEENQTVEVNFSLEPLEVPPPFPEGLRLLLRLEKGQFALGEEIKVELRLVNATDEPVEIVFPSSQRFDLSVRNREGVEVWRWSVGKAFIMVIQEETLQPGEEMEFRASWDQKDKEGKQVPPGEYLMMGELTAEPKVFSQPVGLVILPRP